MIEDIKNFLEKNELSELSQYLLDLEERPNDEFVLIKDVINILKIVFLLHKERSLS